MYIHKLSPEKERKKPIDGVPSTVDTEMNTMPPLLAKWALEYKATNDKSNPELERGEGGHYPPPPPPPLVVQNENDNDAAPVECSTSDQCPGWSSPPPPPEDKPTLITLLPQ